jgi:hypothetical protein
VLAAVPTTNNSSPSRAEKGTTAIEKAASLLSNGYTATLFDWIQHVNVSKSSD